MSGKERNENPSISMLFELDRDDNPWLYDDLIRFKKGTKRINRLRFLAHEGVVAQLGALAAGGMPRPNLPTFAMPPMPLAEGAPSTALPIAGDIFEAPITD